MTRHGNAFNKTSVNNNNQQHWHCNCNIVSNPRRQILRNKPTSECNKITRNNSFNYNVHFSYHHIQLFWIRIEIRWNWNSYTAIKSICIKKFIDLIAALKKYLFSYIFRTRNCCNQKKNSKHQTDISYNSKH